MQKDKNVRLFLKKKELNILALKYLYKHNTLNSIERYLFISKINNLGIKFFLNNHCLITQNNISVNRFSYLSRSNFKNLINCGYMNNIKKSTW